MESRYEIGEIEDFEVKILASGSYSCFLPLSFVERQGKLEVTEHRAGFRQIQVDVLQNPYELLEVIEKLVLCMKEAHNRLIRPERYKLEKNSLYADEAGHQQRIRFMPEHVKGDVPGISEKLRLFLQLWQPENHRCQEYVTRVIEKLTELTLSTEGILSYISELKREVYLCGWDR